MRKTTDIVNVRVAGDGVTLHSLFAIVDEVDVLPGNSTATEPAQYTLTGGTIVPGAPAAGQVQFAGTEMAPTNVLTFAAAQSVGTLVMVSGVADGDAG